MSGYLGFDVGLTAVLAQAMRRAGDELAALRCADPEAASAMRSIGAAAGVLARWAPVVAGLSGCRALEGYVPQMIAPGDLINAWLQATATERGWRTVTDPCAPLIGPPAPMTVDGARALGAALSGAAGAGELDSAEVVWLRARLDEIAARPDLVAAFLPALTTVGWASMCDGLAWRRVERISTALTDDPHAQVATVDGVSPIDACFAALGRLLAADGSEHPESDPTTLLADMSPMAGALLVQHLDLDPATLAAAARQLIEADRADQAAADHTVVGPRAADILFGVMLDIPNCASAYVAATVDDPALVLDVAADPALGNRVAIAGTAADALGCTAGDIVPAFLRWMLDATRFVPYVTTNPDIVATAAAVMAPHLLAIFRPDTAGFGLSSDERSALLSVLTDDRGGALESVLSTRAIAVDAALATIGDATADTDALRRCAADIAAMVAILDTIDRAGELRSAARDLDEWQSTWSFLDRLAGLTSSIDGPVGVVVGPAERAVHKAADFFEWGPPSIADVRQWSLRRVDTATTIAAATLVAARFDALVAAGRIPAGTALPPSPQVDASDVGSDWSAAFGTWIGGIRAPDEVTEQLWAIKQTMLSDHEATVDAMEAIAGI